MMPGPRPSQPDTSRRAAKRRELARHTLTALAELGFARVNLREVAARSGTQLGSIHYYFEDKTDLLTCAVRLYKDEFIQGLERVIGEADSAGGLVERAAAAMVQAIAEQAHLHRLWYDVRAQALFDPDFRPLVLELETQFTELVRHFLDRLRAFGVAGLPSDPLAVYLQADAWFRYCLQRQLSGDSQAGTEMMRRLRRLFEAAQRAHP